jgi:hypothetical protein
MAMAQHVSRVKTQTTQKVRLDIIMFYLSYGFSDSCHAALSKQKLQFLQRLNITFSSVFPTPFLLSSSIYLFHPSFFPSLLSISPRSFPSLSLISLHPLHMCSVVSLSSRHILHLLSSPSVQFLLSFSLSPHPHLIIIFSLSHYPFPDTLEFPLSHTSHTPCCTSVL